MAPPPNGYHLLSAEEAQDLLLNGKGSVRVEVAPGRPVAIFAHRGEFFAIDAACPHQGAGLEDGDIEDSSDGPCVACPRHGWSITLRTGFCEDIDDIGVGTYKVQRLEDGRICVATKSGT